VARPNIIVIKTDQQRADTIAALGHAHMITPNLDRLVREGVSFTNTHCCAATCTPSRAAFYTGQFAHNTGVYGFDDWAHRRTWLHDIQASGYHTSAVGKVHHHPATAMMAFDERLYAENFPEFSAHDDYSNFLKAEGVGHPYEALTRAGDWMEKCVSAPFPFEEKYFVDHWVGTRACEWIDRYEKSEPFYLHVGFVGPHDPFCPPQRWIDLYADRPVPEVVGGTEEWATKPPEYRRFMERCVDPSRYSKPPGHGVMNVSLEDKSPEDIARMRRHYYARVSAIDEQVGFILEALERKGCLENSIILFTSDHGENLGDHGLMFKWLMTEQTTRVPMIVRLPGSMRAARSDVVDDCLASQIDVGPTLLEAAGVPGAASLDGQSQWSRWCKGQIDSVPESVLCEDNYMTMIRTEREKLVYYAGQPYGEYYDLSEDPNQLNNRFDAPDCADRVTALKLNLLERVTCSRYLGSAQEVGLGHRSRVYWPALTPEDPHALHMRPRK